jgi:hypothetical protein
LDRLFIVVVVAADDDDDDDVIADNFGFELHWRGTEMTEQARSWASMSMSSCVMSSMSAR